MFSGGLEAADLDYSSADNIAHSNVSSNTDCSSQPSY
jgi:hypothetical protein